MDMVTWSHGGFLAYGQGEAQESVSESKGLGPQMRVGPVLCVNVLSWAAM